MDTTPDSTRRRSRRSSVNTNDSASWCVTRTIKRNQSHRFTPYRKTPKSRPIHKGIRSSQRSANVLEQTKVREIANKTWKVYRVSPLFDFKKTATSLKSYGKELSSHVKAQSLKRIAIDIQAESADNAQIKLNKELRLSADDHEAIEIIMKQKKKKGDTTEKVVLIAYLLCIGDGSARDVGIKDKFSNLPIMIVQGPVSLSRHLISWLQNTFDCVASPMRFTPTMLSWMLAMFSGYVLDKKTPRQVSMEFKVPTEIKGLSTVTLSIDGKRCKDLWECVHTDGAEDFTQAEVVSFVKSIEAHFYHHFKFDLEAFLLQRIGTNVLYAGSEGKLKIFSSEHVFDVLMHLTDLALECTLKPAEEDEDD